MVTFLMLPFFLVIRLSADDDSWSTYGPEYTYTAHVNINVNAGVKLRAFDMSSTLKCRPRVPDTLNCRFDNTGMKFYRDGLADLGEDSIKVWDMSEESFDVRFNKNGISDLVVSKSMTPSVISGLRAIVNQLNVGVDVRKRHDHYFKTMEKSYIGECIAVVRISHKPMQDDGLWNDNMYEIAPMAGFNKAPGEVVEITKYRSLDECADKANYFFGSKDVSPSVYGSTFTQLTSSVSHIKVSDTNFTSYTANEFIVTNVNTGKNVKLYEKISLKLDSVAPDGNEYATVEKLAPFSFPSFKRPMEDWLDEQEKDI